MAQRKNHPKINQPDQVLAQLAKTKILVIKIGSSVLTEGKGRLSEKVFQWFSKEIADLQHQGKRCIIVTSGAVAAGKSHLSFKNKTLTIPQKQAAAAVGQGHLMHLYQEHFSKFGLTAAQMLLTHDDLSHRTRYLNARNTITTLLDQGVVPIINENDSVVVEEIKFGDNDTLSALIATLVEAHAFLILTDCAGLFDGHPNHNPKAELIHCVDVISEKTLSYASEVSGEWGVGGMLTKIRAAQRTTTFGIPTIIAQGGPKHDIGTLFSGKPFIGTLLLPKVKDLSARKHWIVHTLKPKGKITVDLGAATAILSRGKSLLPGGIVETVGEFKLGECVEICQTNHAVIGRGLVNYSALEINQIKGKKTGDIEKILGYKYFDEVIHRDQMVLIEQTIL